MKGTKTAFAGFLLSMAFLTVSGQGTKVDTYEWLLMVRKFPLINETPTELKVEKETRQELLQPDAQSTKTKKEKYIIRKVRFREALRSTQ
jgi:hypothetical protein